MSVGDVFRVETGVGTASDVCGEPGGSSPVHTFEVVETPAPGDFDGLTVSPPTLAEETDEYVDIIERTGTGRTFVARVSTVGVEVALPPEFEALAGSVRVEFYLDNDLMLRERSLCVPALHWKNQQVVGGVIAEDFATICEVLDDSQREATDGIQRDFQRLDGVMRARIFVPGTTLEWWSEEEPLAFGCEPPSGGEDAGGGGSDAGSDDDAGSGGAPGDEVEGGAEESSGEDGGCAQGGGRTPAPWWMLGVVFVWMRRRTS